MDYNIEKIKDNLNEELERIKDEKSSIFNEIRNLQKEEAVIGYNLEFFSEYLRRLDNGASTDDIQDYIKEKSKPNEDRNIYNKGDIIDENLHGFDHGVSFSNSIIGEKQTREAHRRIKKKKKTEHTEHNQYEDDERIKNETVNNIKTVIENYNDDNYFCDLINKNFYS